jgi:DeoR family transcriptional regulator, aga operon transcriptional repressor
MVACHDGPVLTPTPEADAATSAPEAASQVAAEPAERPEPAEQSEEPRGRRMRRAQRVEAILNELGETGNVHVGELSERFGVSEATLRRDLTLLEEQALLTRTHGGALAQHVGYSLPARQRDLTAGDTNKAIARLAAHSVPDGAHVTAFTGGDITSEVARLLSGRTDLTVVTTALTIALDVASRGAAKLMVMGGVARPGSLELTGPWPEQIAQTINIGTLFIHGEGLSAADGLTSSDEAQVRTTQALIARAQRVVVVAPGSAIGHVALTRIAGVDDVHEVVTDASAPGPHLSALQEAGIAVGIVPHG